MKRRARVWEPSSKGMVNAFPLILGGREQGTKAKIAYKPKCARRCDVIEYYESAISYATNNTWVRWRRGWSSARFEFTIEELIECPIRDERLSRKLHNFGATYLYPFGSCMRSSSKLMSYVFANVLIRSRTTGPSSS